jgi:two-component system sensor histidine kinase KdpD
MLPGRDGRLESVASGDRAFVPREKDGDVVEWVSSHGKPAGLSTETLPFARALYTPLLGGQGPAGVLGVLPNDPRRFNDPEQRALLDVFASQIASALERSHFAERNHHAQVRSEADGSSDFPSSSGARDLRAPSTSNKAAAGRDPHRSLHVEGPRDEEER